MAVPQVAVVRPHRTAGTVLLILGLVMLVAGIAAALYCSVSLFGVCLDNPYAGLGSGLAALGFILLILGVVLMVMTGPGVPIAAPGPLVYLAQPTPYPAPSYYSAAPPPPPPPQPAPTGAERYCQSCGMGNTRVAAFCQKCGKPLPPPS